MTLETPSVFSGLTRCTKLRLWTEDHSPLAAFVLAQLPGLREIDLSYTELTGEFPGAQQQQPALANLITGLREDPGGLLEKLVPQMPYITRLRLDDVSFGDSFPTCIYALTNLVSLELTITFGLPEVADGIHALSKLTNLDVDGDKCDSMRHVSPDIGGLSLLESLNLCSHPELERLPRELFGLTRLTKLNIGWLRQLRGGEDIAPLVSALSNLKVLWTLATPISAMDMIRDDADLPLLEHLMCGGPERFDEPTPLVPLPAAVFRAPLRKLTMHNLQGPLPPTLARATGLTKLDVYHGDLTELPVCLGPLWAFVARPSR